MEELDQYNKFQKRMAERFPEYFGEDKRYGGFAIGEGWYHIIEALCANIQSHMKWKEQNRQRAIELFTARERGLEALIAFYQGKSKQPSDWDIVRAEETMAEGVIIPPEVPPIEIQQIKEKFGGLRFYYEGGDEYVSGLVTMAESWASRSCERCGDIGEQRGGGWIRTLCHIHEEEYQTRKQNV